MLLDIAPDVFAAAHQVSAFDLLSLFVHGQHEWSPTPEAALTAEQFLASSPEGSELTEFARKAVEESINPRRLGPTKISVTVTDLDLVVADLKKPAVIVVENALHDGQFLLTVAHAFGYGHIVEAKRKRWLHVVNAGGTGQIAPTAADERQHFHVVIRVAALLDSDRKEPDGPAENEIYAARIRAAGVTEVHMWRWQEVENYVPCRVWEHRFPGKGTRIAMLRLMKPHHRGYLDIKNGLGSPTPGCFSDLPDDVARAWRTGLNPSGALIPDGLVLTRKDFDELGVEAVAELEELFAMINRIL